MSAPATGCGPVARILQLAVVLDFYAPGLGEELRELVGELTATKEPA